MNLHTSYSFGVLFCEVHQMTPLRRLLFLLAAPALLGQQASQTFHLTTVTNTAALHEVGTILRTVGGIGQIAVDDVKFAITVGGTDNDIALAAWMVKQLDTTELKPAQYAIPGGTEVLNVLYLANSPQQYSMNELVSALRAVAGVPQIFIYSPSHGVVLRTPVAAAPMALWLAHQLDVAPTDQNRWQPREYDIPGAPTQVMRVIYLLHPMPQPADLNEMLSTIRTIADLHAIFTRSQPQGIAFRGTAAQAQLGDWLFQQLDVEPDDEMRAHPHDYILPDTEDGITRVYYLRNASLNDILQAIRSETMPVRPRMFTCTRHRAIVVRGTSDVIAIADRVVKEHDTP
jgi:hypothetical protein